MLPLKGRPKIPIPENPKKWATFKRKRLIFGEEFFTCFIKRNKNSRILLMYPSHRGSFALLPGETGVKYLNPEELQRLTESYRNRFETPQGKRYRRRERARHWIIFLLLRYTGARLSEVLSLDDRRDLNFCEASVRLPTLKRHNRLAPSREVPLPGEVLGEVGRILAEFPSLRGHLFSCHRSTIFRYFQARAKEVSLPRELSHPHVLRHTRAIEMLRAGVPISIVQELLGHASLHTTAIYLRFSSKEIKMILREKGVL